MRILFVADVPADPNSGAAGTEYQTILALRELGHKVDAIWGDAIPRRIAHPNLHYLLELPRGFARAISKACRGKNYDVIHCNQPHAYLAAREHHALGRPGVFINRSHGFETHVASVLALWRKRWDLVERRFPRNIPGALIDAEMRRQCRLVLRHADGLIVSSRADLQYILGRYTISANRVACIPQAVPDGYRTAPTRPMALERLRKLLFIGPPALYKGPNVLGPAVSAVLAAHPECEFTWVCARQEWDIAAGYLSAAARARVTFADPMPQDDLLALYDRHGIFLFPSLYEGFGKAFLEAMSRGLCVVASNTGGMADLITAERDGILVPVGDAVALEEAVEQLLRHPDLAQRMAAEARVVALDYSWARVARLTASFYESLRSSIET